MRQAVIVRTDAGSEPAHGPPSRWLMRMGGGATWGAGRLRTLLRAVCGRRITFGVTPRDQTAHQIKNVVDLSKRIPKEKSDERKSSQQRIEDDSSASAG